MKIILSFLAAVAFSVPSFARTMTCVLTGPGGKVSAKQSVPAQYDDYAFSETIGDLSFNLANSCIKDECTGYLTIDSAMAQDEVGSTAFEFSKKAEGHVYAEAVTNAPDKKPYKISCELKQ